MIYASEVARRWARWNAGARQRVSAYWRDHTKKDPTYEKVFVTIEIVFGGDTSVFVARDAIETTSGIDGRVFAYQPALVDEPSIMGATDLGDQSAQARSASFEILSSIVDVSAILAKGRMLAGIAEVSLQLAGGDYDQRLVLMRGDVTAGISFGEDGENIVISISDPRETQSLLVPDIVVDAVRWPNAQDSAVGERIPRVINGFDAIPALRVLDDWGATGLYFAVCDRPDEFDIDTVYVNGAAKASADMTYGWSEGTVIDGKGSRILVVNASSSMGPWEERDAVHVTVSRASGVAARSVIDIIQVLLGEYTAFGPLGLDIEAFSYAQGRMLGESPKVLINASGSDVPDILGFIESGLLDSFPMVNLVFEGPGIGPVIIDRRVGPAGDGIVADLEIGKFPLIQRVGGYDETPKSEIFTAFELRWGYNLLDDTYAGVLIRDPSNSPACALAREMIGGDRPHSPIESPHIVTEKLAAYVMDWMIAHRTVPSYTVVCSAFPWVHARLRLGQNVRFTDPAFAVFTSAVATVTSLAYERGDHQIGFRVWHPMRETGLYAGPGA